MTPSQSKVTVVTILLSLFDRVGGTECRSEANGVQSLDYKVSSSQGLSPPSPGRGQYSLAVFRPSF